MAMFEDAVRGDCPHPYDAPGHADHGRVIRHGVNDNGAGADLHVIADANTAEDLGAGSDDHVVADGRMPLALLVARAAESDALIEHHIVTDFSSLTDHDAHAMVNEEAPADGGARMDFDAGEQAGDLRNESRQNRHTGLVEPVREAMHQYGVKSGIAEDD